MLEKLLPLQGRFLALAGFGNLPGDVVFYDRKSDGRCKQMGAIRCSSCAASMRMHDVPH